MDSGPAKHPKKKRRIDDGQEDGQSLPGPSNAIMPLVAPHLVKKSSKDPNRGMYPSSRERHKKHSLPEFVKASELCKNSPPKDEKSLSADPPSQTTNSGKINPSDINLASSSSSGNSSGKLTKTGADFKVVDCPHGKKKRVPKFPPSSSSHKITKFFKGPPVSKQQLYQSFVKKKNISKPTETDVTKDKPGPSGWEEVDEVLFGAITDNEYFFKQYQQCYGLIDIESETKEEGMDYFKILPTHIIETILCQIPVLDLMTCREVCTRWHDIIDNEKFMEWKKLYHRYKRECSEPMSAHRQKIRAILTKYGHAKMEDCIETLLKYMLRGFNRMPSTDMYDLLTQNPKGELAASVLLERFPDFNEKESRVWCHFALAILLCETVWDILDLYKSLFTIHSSCLRSDIIDAMYCVATFLLFYQTCEAINCGLHYRLYYVLYLIENHVPDFQREKLKIVHGLPGQQSIHSYSKSDCSHLTYEQIRILNHKFDMHQKVRIIAMAGTGKTTTLLHLSRLYPQIKFLNLVFNKSVNDEARKKFPANVTCKTAHSLAYAVQGKYLRHKLTPKLRPFDLIGHLRHNEEHIQIYAYANLVLTTINNFTVSKSKVMCLDHVPLKDLNRRQISTLNRDRILMDSYKIWQKMIDVTDPFKITHDVYLKLYHLMEPKLDKYQCIMVDEAQDCNPVILDIVNNQSMPVIFVGDPHQQIYGFRGAQNALQDIKATHTYHLTKSFRFGPEIAYMASCILELMMSSKKHTIVGNNKDSFVNGHVDGQYAVISRTNVMLFNEALRMIVFKRLKTHEPDRINAAFAGGFNSYGFDQISDIYKLKSLPRDERQLTDRFISRFKSYQDLESYAKYSEDADLIMKIEIVKQHDHNISKFLTILRENCSHPMELANVVFSTAHKAKGLEFDTVCLADDYPVSAFQGYVDTLSGPPMILGENAREESNILYVALTRAKRSLLLPEKMKKLLSRAHERFEYPVPAKSVVQDSETLVCAECFDEFTPHTVLLLMRRKLLLASDREISGGPLCMKCCSDPYMRPDIHMNGLIMYLDATSDNAHRFMSPLVGPLPGDPPIVHDRFSQFHNADRVFVINLNML